MIDDCSEASSFFKVGFLAHMGNYKPYLKIVFCGSGFCLHPVGFQRGSRDLSLPNFRPSRLEAAPTSQ